MSRGANGACAGFFTFGAVAFFFVAFALLWDGRAYARVLGADVFRIYTILAIWTVLIWTVYPIIWGVSEGGNIIPPDSEAVSYGILDLLTKRKFSNSNGFPDHLTHAFPIAVFGAALIWGIRNVDIERLGIHVSDINPSTRTPVAAAKTEKDAEAAAAGEGVTAPPATEAPAESAV